MRHDQVAAGDEMHETTTLPAYTFRKCCQHDQSEGVHPLASCENLEVSKYKSNKKSSSKHRFRESIEERKPRFCSLDLGSDQGVVTSEDAMTLECTYPISEIMVSWLESFCLTISKHPSCYAQ